MDPEERATEGPFGEWTGYYASNTRPEPLIRVQRIYHRNDPILTGARPGRPPSDYSIAKCMVKAASSGTRWEKAGVPDVKGVWCHEAGGGRLLNIISIKQRYPGHARQAGMVASQVHAGAYLGRYVIVVDDDIDPTKTFDVLWAWPPARIRGFHRYPAALLEWTAGPAYPAGQEGLQLPRHHRRHPALRVDEGFSARGRVDTRAQAEGVRQVAPRDRRIDFGSRFMRKGQELHAPGPFSLRWRRLRDERHHCNSRRSEVKAPKGSGFSSRLRASSSPLRCQSNHARAYQSRMTWGR